MQVQAVPGAITTHDSEVLAGGTTSTADFDGTVNTNNELPSPELLKKIEDYVVLDEDNKSRPFKSVCTGSNVARRVLVIFVRHFYCGNCQEYLRTLSENVTPEALLTLPVPTSIAVIGCGAPSLIQEYRAVTGCSFPIYAEPSQKLYDELGMMRTLAMGERPEYQRASNISLMLKSAWQGLKQVPTGNVLAGGDMKQVGGEFLFEPVSDVLLSPIIASPASPGQNANFEEEKRVVWCHRMKNTRDHVEIPELREVLGFDDAGKPGKNQKRWSIAQSTRKGSGVSGLRSRMSLDSGRALNEEGKPGERDASQAATTTHESA